MPEQIAVVDDEPYQRALNRIAAVQASGEDTLSLKGLGLDTLPTEIGELTELRTLDVDFNRLSTLPDWIGNLTGLQSLNLSGNGLSTLPD
ncbi:leucine-rich repeat domain-containing protein [uncultured Methylobacterium sp.]|uniref:leucine-rich repeat domain-containing protein n=1 Tax=uncultured Methylobacterium sp. TaxID=157278 RepID=UPI0035CB7A41